MNTRVSEIDAIIALAGTGKVGTRRLLQAIAKNEGDSDTGDLMRSILTAGPYYAKSFREDFEEAEEEANNILVYAEKIADEYRGEAIVEQERG